MYHYAGGIAFAALKRWADAEEFFEMVVSAPGQVPSAIQLEALKKLVLVQLISKGKVSPILVRLLVVELDVFCTDDQPPQIHEPDSPASSEKHAIFGARERLPAADQQSSRNS